MNATTELNRNPGVVFNKEMREKIYKYAYSEFMLNKRPSEVLRLAVEGWTNNEIADHLCISLKAVKTHLTHIYKTLGIKNRQSLILKLPIFKDDLNKFDPPPKRMPLTR